MHAHCNTSQFSITTYPFNKRGVFCGIFALESMNFLIKRRFNFDHFKLQLFQGFYPPLHHFGETKTDGAKATCKTFTISYASAL